MDSNKHIPVLAEKLIESIKFKPNMIVVDCTLGRGGHSQLILDKLLGNSFLYGFDQDQDAIDYCKNKFKNHSNIKLIKDNFVNIKKHIDKKVDAIIMDIGVSSPQFDNANRGFSYMHNGKLDMRMDQSQKLNAKLIVNEYSLEKLIEIFFKYGEEKYSKSIAKAIIEKREQNEISTTLELVEIIKESVPFSYKKLKHPAKKVFQALRIEVNDELNNLSKALGYALEILAPKGSLSVISFHSLEDRIVKKLFSKLTTPSKSHRDIPKIDIDDTKYILVNKKPILPNQSQIDHNPRSKSAKLRTIRKKG